MKILKRIFIWIFIGIIFIAGNYFSAELGGPSLFSFDSAVRIPDNVILIYAPSTNSYIAPTCIIGNFRSKEGINNFIDSINNEKGEKILVSTTYSEFIKNKGKLSSIKGSKGDYDTNPFESSGSTNIAKEFLIHLGLINGPQNTKRWNTDGSWNW